MMEETKQELRTAGLPTTLTEEPVTVPGLGEIVVTGYHKGGPYGIDWLARHAGDGRGLTIPTRLLRDAVDAAEGSKHVWTLSGQGYHAAVHLCADDGVHARGRVTCYSTGPSGYERHLISIDRTPYTKAEDILVYAAKRLAEVKETAEWAAKMRTELQETAR